MFFGTKHLRGISTLLIQVLAAGDDGIIEPVSVFGNAGKSPPGASASPSFTENGTEVDGPRPMGFRFYPASPGGFKLEATVLRDGVPRQVKVRFKIRVASKIYCHDGGSSMRRGWVHFDTVDLTSIRRWISRIGVGSVSSCVACVSVVVLIVGGQ